MPVGFASAFIRHVLRLGGRLSGGEHASFVRLRAKAGEVRMAYIARPALKGHVAALEYVSLVLQEPIRVEATSRANSPSPLPPPRSQGGYSSLRSIRARIGRWIPTPSTRPYPRSRGGSMR